MEAEGHLEKVVELLEDGVGLGLADQFLVDVDFPCQPSGVPVNVPRSIHCISRIANVLVSMFRFRFGFSVSVSMFRFRVSGSV